VSDGVTHGGVEHSSKRGRGSTQAVDFGEVGSNALPFNTSSQGAVRGGVVNACGDCAADIADAEFTSHAFSDCKGANVEIRCRGGVTHAEPDGEHSVNGVTSG